MGCCDSSPWQASCGLIEFVRRNASRILLSASMSCRTKMIGTSRTELPIHDERTQLACRRGPLARWGWSRSMRAQRCESSVPGRALSKVQKETFNSRPWIRITTVSNNKRKFPGACDCINLINLVVALLKWSQKPDAG